MKWTCPERGRHVAQINPAVLGGVVVDFGDKTIDLSVASRVNKLNNLLSRMLSCALSVTAVNPHTYRQNPYERPEVMCRAYCRCWRSSCPAKVYVILVAGVQCIDAHNISVGLHKVQTFCSEGNTRYGPQELRSRKMTGNCHTAYRDES